MVDKLTVIVCDHPTQSISGELRGAWLREIHPDAEVLVVPDTLPDDRSDLWAEFTIELLGQAPDVVFTSEDYGESYARFLGCDNVVVDKQRVSVPCSGTQIRNAPLSHLDFLEPCVRANFVKRICVIGAESTGTTTMAEALAEHFQTAWVPEYGREYWIWKVERGEVDRWTSEEFLAIAVEQARREDEAARTANKVLICDTDPFATSIWHERYLRSRFEPLDRFADSRHYDLYLLTGNDIPFVQDGFRDGEHIRDWMHGRFVEELTRTGRRFVSLCGPHEERLATAVGGVEGVLERGLSHETWRGI
jgi:NadR type nicotinamide-nucleotide adenylyltransferase